MRPVISSAVFVLILIANLPSSLQKGNEEKIRYYDADYNDADYERSYEQWEDEQLSEDEKSQHLQVSRVHSV